MRLFAVHDHYLAHARPVWDRLPQELRDPADGLGVVLSYAELNRARRAGCRAIARLTHGAGQSYGGREKWSRDPFGAGGKDWDAVSLFLVPNDHSRDRWLEAYPGAEVRVVGALPERPGRHPDLPGPTVALAWHWDHPSIPEARSAWGHYADALPDLARRFQVLGHGHPRAWPKLAAAYRDMGIEATPDFDEVCRRADVLVADNTSVLYEWARMDRPVVVLDAPWYDRTVDHGLRYWDAADAGVRIGEPEYLVGAVARALEDQDPLPQVRRDAARQAFTYRDGAARAAAALTEWAVVK